MRDVKIDPNLERSVQVETISWYIPGLHQTLESGLSFRR